ncbi:MAG: cell division protein FtsL [Gammaproteobacteria bacterium]|nr:MAG: cell division protein FtsL [Gammaproteobacteria bacterium]
MSRRWLFLLLPVLWVAVLASALGVVHARHRARGLFVQLEQLANERDRLNIEWGQLQLEQSAWSNHGFVEQVASERLRMTLPRPDEVRIVAP